MTIIVGVPASVLELNQQGLLERAFHDGLFPNLAYRSEAMFEQWEGQMGQEILMSRPGLLTPRPKPLTPGSDPTPQTVPYEQWKAVLSQYGDGVDTHMPTAVTSNANLFLRNIHQLGLNAGQTINRVSRNALFQAYLGGWTVLTAATAAPDTTVKVAALNGFTDVIVPGVNAQPKPVAPASPLAIKIGTTSFSVIGANPDDPSDPFGPGTLVLSAAVGAIIATRTAVVSKYAPRIVRTGGGDSVDALGAGDTLTLQDCINAVGFLRRASVPPHEDGYYHAHISPLANSQLFADPVFQRLNQSLPDGRIYKPGFIGEMSGILFYQNNESPDALNTGDRKATSATAYYSSEIGAETTNNGGIDVGRVIITGKGALYEKGFDESNFVTEAGTTGKIGEFQVVNNGMSILTERIRLVLAAPLDRLQQVVRASWSITTSFPTPSDILAPSGPERFKRAIVLEHAL